MLLTPHVLVGTAIASIVPNPVVSVPLSIAFHFLGDMVPHWDFYTDTTREQRSKGWRVIGVMGDLGLAVAAGMYFTCYFAWVIKDPSLSVNAFLCGIGSVIPDALTAPYIYRENGVNIVSDAIHKIQSKMQFPAKLPWGIITQIAVSLFSFLVIANSIM
jgi:hypothetical protein